MNRSGPGELTLVAVALVGITTYAALAGTESGEVTLAAVGLFAMVLFVAGVAWPCIALARVEVDATTQTDATVGDVVPVQLEVKGRVSRMEVRALDPPSEWRTCRAPGSGELLHTASRRGVFRYLRVEVRSAAPLGVFQRRRVLVARLARPIAVGPRPTHEEPVAQPVLSGDATTPLPVPSPLTGDAVRAVRPYVAGDPARLVHWPTSARRGELVVREHDPMVLYGVALVVDLRGEPAQSEATASRAAGVAIATLAAGGRVVLSTVEADGPVVAPVVDRRGVGRRLAAALAAPYAPAPAVPEGWPAFEVRAR